MITKRSTIDRRYLADRVTGMFLILLLVLLWEIVSTSGILQTNFLPSASQTGVSLWHNLSRGILLFHVSNTLFRMALGYILSFVIGVSLGMAMGLKKSIDDILDPIVQFMRPLPTVMIIPMAILFFGIGDLMKVVVISYACLWPILINSRDGVRNIDRVLSDTAHIFRLKGYALFKKVLIPAASFFILSGMRVSLAVAMILSVTTEFLVGPNGVGFFIIEALNSSRVADMYAGVVFVGFTAYLINRAFLFMRGQLMGWQRGVV